MLKKRIIIPILFAFLLIIASASAANNLANDTVSISENSDYSSVVESIGNDSEILQSSSKSFMDLNTLINNNSDLDIYLSDDYVYNPDKDSQFATGIPIIRSINVYGNGHTINGNNQARIFNVSNYVNFNNINFINAYSDMGSAIIGSNYAILNCNFTNNHATISGGAIQGGYARNCIFNNNIADKYGGAMYQGSTDNSIFNGNYALEGGAIYDVYATQSTFTKNSAGKQGGAMLGSSASKCTFIANSAQGYSGAVFNAYVVDCTFINNTATHAGAIGGGSNSAQECTFIGNYALDDGGAVYGYTVFNSVFRQNHATQGGAMHTGSVNNCIFEDNYAINVGGALMETYAVNCNFTNNSAYKGGAMYQNSAKNCNFINNTADYGGAMFNSHADTCKFRYNTAKQQGGAIYEGGADSAQFYYNSAINGGAIALSDVAACTFVENTARDYGGAAYRSSARRCYFGSNVAKYGGGLSVESSASECKFEKNLAIITGGAKYDAYVAESEFEGNLPGYTLSASDFTGIEGFGGDIHIELYDSPNYPVTGVNATIKVYNSKSKLIGTYTSEVGYNWFINYAAGKYKTTISVEDPCYEVDPIKISITILKSSFIYVAAMTTNYQSGQVLMANLHDSAGTAIKYAKMSVVLNGVKTTYTTNDYGQIMIPTKSLKPGTYTATITYDGDSTYIKSTATAKITIKKRTPKITAAKATFKVKDKTKKYIVTLKDNKGKVMKSTKITIKVKGKTYSAKTASTGKATFKLTKLTKKGTFSAVITYSGSSIYNSVKKTVKITVK